MTDAFAHHIDLVRSLSKPGHALAVGAPTSTMNNPRWWVDGEPTLQRQKVHVQLLEQMRDAQPAVTQDSRAVVMAGPPGAGKGTIQATVLGGERDQLLLVDADEFKRLLLTEALRDGSYDSWLMPDALRELANEGEQFFPLELASLVHEESSYLATQFRDHAIAAGDNVLIDTVLGHERAALQLGGRLAGAGYDVRVIDVEVPYELSEARIHKRWRDSYQDALQNPDGLGGRWVPSEYARDVFDGPGGLSRPEANARTLAEQCTAVTRYQLFRTSLEHAVSEEVVTPVLEVEMIRRTAGDPLQERRAADDTAQLIRGRYSREAQGATAPMLPRRGVEMEPDETSHHGDELDRD